MWFCLAVPSSTSPAANNKHQAPHCQPQRDPSATPVRPHLGLQGRDLAPRLPRRLAAAEVGVGDVPDEVHLVCVRGVRVLLCNAVGLG